MSDKKPERKTVVLGVTGSIAAYKAADLCSRLVKADLDVVVVMTMAARELITPRTFLTLSRNPVITSLWDAAEWKPEHTDLADRAVLLVVAPCTANFMGKYAHGVADDALTTLALTHDGPALLAPAMNPRMWAHPAVQDNRALLERRGVELVGPASGTVACGDEGVGRMAEVDAILDKILTILKI